MIKISREEYNRYLESYYGGIREGLEVLYNTEEEREKAFQRFKEGKAHKEFLKSLEEYFEVEE